MTCLSTNMREIGAGAGRLTRELADITNRVVVGDISPGQLDLRSHGGKYSYNSAAASNSLSAAWDEALVEIAKDNGKWDQLIQMEIEAAAEPGCLDIGTHLIAVCRRP